MRYTRKTFSLLSYFSVFEKSDDSFEKSDDLPLVFVTLLSTMDLFGRAPNRL